MPRKNHRDWTDGATPKTHKSDKGSMRMMSSLDSGAIRQFNRIRTPGTNKIYINQEILAAKIDQENESKEGSSITGLEIAQQM